MKLAIRCHHSSCSKWLPFLQLLSLTQFTAQHKVSMWPRISPNGCSEYSSSFSNWLSATYDHCFLPTSISQSVRMSVSSGAFIRFCLHLCTGNHNQHFCNGSSINGKHVPKVVLLYNPFTNRETTWVTSSRTENVREKLNLERACNSPLSFSN